MDAPGSEDPVLTASDDRRARDHFRVDPPPPRRSHSFNGQEMGPVGEGHGVAVLIPCFNEELTVAAVVRGFKAVLPFADVYVYDNNSTDRTVARAAEADAIVRTERRQGKGQTVRRMFADIHADIYLLVDGDDTYDATVATRVVAQIVDGGLDFVNVARVSTSAAAYRPGHRIGNVLLSRFVRSIFGRESTDMLSGYKGLSRRFVKSFPAMSSGFETETELTVHALELRMPMAEIAAPYKERPLGSTSKLRTFRDGMKIFLLIWRLVKDERPFQFFGLMGLMVLVFGAVLAVPIFQTYFETGLVPRLPTAVLCVSLLILGFFSIFTGLILDVVTKTRNELKRLAYLSLPPPSPAGLFPNSYGP
jgi:glycosyltransferase involved in cell wall biosynthesis